MLISMKSKQPKNVEAVIDKMTANEIAAVLAAVKKWERQVEGDLVIKERAYKMTHCPYCSSPVMRWGSKNGVPHFKCKNEETDTAGKKVCGKTFNALTGTPLARLHHIDKHIESAKCTCITGCLSARPQPFLV